MQREAAAAAGSALQAQAQPQQGDQTAHDGQAQAQALAAVARQVADLEELLEHALVQRLVDTGSAVDHAERDGLAVAPQAQQHLAALRELERIAQQVLQHAAQQGLVATHLPGAAAALQLAVKAQAALPGLRLVGLDQRLHEALQIDDLGVGLHGAGVELRYLEQAVEQALALGQRAAQAVGHPRQGLVLAQARQRLDGGHVVRQRGERLAQVVAGGGEEARARLGGLLGALALALQVLVETDQVELHQTLVAHVVDEHPHQQQEEGGGQPGLRAVAAQPAQAQRTAQQQGTRRIAARVTGRRRHRAGRHPQQHGGVEMVADPDAVAEHQRRQHHGQRRVDEQAERHQAQLKVDRRRPSRQSLHGPKPCELGGCRHGYEEQRPGSDAAAHRQPGQRDVGAQARQQHAARLHQPEAHALAGQARGLLRGQRGSGQPAHGGGSIGLRPGRHPELSRKLSRKFSCVRRPAAPGSWPRRGCARRAPGGWRAHGSSPWCRRCPARGRSACRRRRASAPRRPRAGAR